MMNTIAERVALVHVLNEWRAMCALRYALTQQARHDAWRRHSVAAWDGTALVGI